ncbi:sperm flagellar 1 [Pelobates cultripes]|uniref:Sperm flagellar 1 n=2 Tax=Pelobates cultripes TaxID=61616 RepID=A0AAD1TA21_PELCU|nr:sperm flagellar 1 [Pelobates cultripes]
MTSSEVSEEQLQELYAWIDQVPLSRTKRNITRDFSDGVLVAEVVKHFLPKIVEMHNYIPANSTQQKLSNWGILNRKVFSKLNFHVPEDIVRRLISNAPGVIESVLYSLRQKINEKLQENSQRQRGTTQVKESEYYSTKTGQPTGPDALLSPTHSKAFPGYTDQSQNHTKRVDGRLHQYTHVEPRVRLLLEEKEQELMALQETVQILQMKVQRLEHLVQLKDLRIEDLTRHLNKQRGHRNIT